jgi:hypothetical protein
MREWSCVKELNVKGVAKVSKLFMNKEFTENESYYTIAPITLKSVPTPVIEDYRVEIEQ